MHDFLNNLLKPCVLSHILLMTLKVIDRLAFRLDTMTRLRLVRSLYSLDGLFLQLFDLGSLLGGHRSHLLNSKLRNIEPVLVEILRVRWSWWVLLLLGLLLLR